MWIRAEMLVIALSLAGLAACSAGQVGGDPLPDGSVRHDTGRVDVPRDVATPDVTAREVCGNGLDDDWNGQVDERCPCTPGTSQRCYPRPTTETIGVGPCAWGQQGCEGTGEFGLWTECVGPVIPTTDVCGDHLDQDCNGRVDDGPGCLCTDMTLRRCYAGPDGTDGVGLCHAGMQTCVGGDWGPCAGEVVPATEICNNMLDDDCNGHADDGTACACMGLAGATRTCYSGPRTEVNVGICRAGRQTCNTAGTMWGPCTGEIGPRAEICGNGLDDDCNGMPDDRCPTVIEVPISIDGDCVTARCPPSAPYPVGCNIRMAGDDPRGCVASRPDNPVVYFQEGDACGAGRVTGTLRCSSVRGAGLNAMNCIINKTTRYYPTDRSGCPDT